MIVQTIINGRQVTVDAEPGQTLLEFLRELNLKSVKHGCDHGECGACGVLVDDHAMNACLLLVHQVHGKVVETVESFDSTSAMKQLQDAFLDEGAIQCGYCTPGMLISLEALRRNGRGGDEAAVRDALAGNLCRCTGYAKPVKAGVKFLAGAE